MPINSSVGYEGTVDERGWARLSFHFGRTYGFGGQNHWRVQPVPGVDRTVRVTAGSGYGRGVLDTASDTDIQLPPVASGSRWDTIVARRDWQPRPGTTTFEYVTGGTSQALAGGLNTTTPGVIDDQPLALVQITAGQTAPTAVVDLREGVWHNLPLASGIAVGPFSGQPRFRRDRDEVVSMGSVRLASGANFPTSAITVGTLPITFRPTATRFGASGCNMDADGGGTVRLEVTPAGVITAALNPLQNAVSWIALDNFRFFTTP